jgi:RNA polymerase sigma-70 factor (ECF subfamily)
MKQSGHRFVPNEDAALRRLTVCYTPFQSTAITDMRADDESNRPSPDLTSTIQLVALAQAGDAAAIDRLFARHGPPLRRWARGRLPQWARDLADTDDLVQEALLQTFKRIQGFEARGTGSLHAYLRRAIVNRIRDELRRKRRRPDLTELDSGQVDEQPSPLERAISQSELQRYERALAGLRPEEQEAIVARVEMGYSDQELAESLGKPSADAARKAAKRALVRLAEAMDQDDG